MNKRGPALTKKKYVVGVPVTKRIKQLQIRKSIGKESLIFEATERISTKFGTARFYTNLIDIDSTVTEM